MTDEVRRDVVKVGLDFRSIPVDVGDGVIWDFAPDPSPKDWSTLFAALKAFSGLGKDDFDEKSFETAMTNLSKAMSNVITDEGQKKKWLKRNYGLSAQQAVSASLMELWTGFPTNQPSPSGTGSKKTG